MITSENYEHMLLCYQRIKNLVYLNNLSREEFLRHLNEETDLGKEFKSYFEEISSGNTTAEINDFMEIMFPTEGSKFSK